MTERSRDRCRRDVDAHRLIVRLTADDREWGGRRTESAEGESAKERGFCEMGRFVVSYRALFVPHDEPVV